MSFLLDPPLLFAIGIALYLASNRLRIGRLAKITIGLLIVLTFIAFSLLLYTDVFRCVFPVVCNGMSGSEFMFHSNITGIYKSDVPLLVVILLFALYPVWIYLGYASAFLLSKRTRVSKDVYSYKDVKSRKKIIEPEYSVVRYPDTRRDINDSEGAVRSAIDALGGMQSFVKRGDKVLIKVNICGGVPELTATYTTKDVAGVVVDMVREAGGEPVICDADMIWTKFWANAKKQGWDTWAQEKGVELMNLSDTKIVHFDFGDKSVLKRERVSKEMLDADVIISVPAMKTHLMTGVTLGMKNMYGTLPEIDKARYHQIGIDEVLYWINYAFTPNLTVIDGSIGGETVGPLSCDAVDFRTIIASTSVVTADAIAAQMIGFKNPCEEIDHLKLAHERSLGDASQEFDFTELPYKHSSDGNWKRPDPDVARFYTWGTHQILKIPGWATLFNIGADFFLYDTARLPLLKYFTPAFLQIIHDIAKWSMEKKPAPDSTKRKRTNLAIFSVLALLSIFGFVSGGYLAISSLEFALGFLFALILAALFAMRMQTKHFVAVSSASILIAYLVERFAVLAGMWHYVDGAAPPLFALFSMPIFMIVIIGLSHGLRRVFAYVDLSGRRFRIAPFVLILFAFAAFLWFEGYLAIATPEIIAIYAAFAVLGLFYNNRQTLDWNLAFATVATALGGTMELLGTSAGLWSFAFDEGMPVFISFAWALNGWAVCGIAQIFGADLGDAIAG